MAGIDKTYLTSIDDMVKVGEWLKSLPYEVTDDYGNKHHPKNYIYEELRDALISGREACEKFVDEYLRKGDDGSWCCVLWNTDYLFDVWLMRHCPVSCIQKRLSEQYDEVYIRSVMDHQCEYDLFVRPETAERFVIKTRPHYRLACKQCWWVSLDYKEGYMSFYESGNRWALPNEPYTDDGTMSSVAIIRGHMCPRKIKRLIRRWNLPMGVKMTIRGDYDGQEWLVETK